MILYPYLTAFILTDELFSRFGGDPNASPYDLRQSAYQIAESAVYYDLETPLRLTTFTGTFAYSPSMILDHAYVQSIQFVHYIDAKGTIYRTVTGTSNYEVNLDDADMGLVSITPYCSYPCFSNSVGYLPDKVQVIYTAGLASGTSYDGRILSALTQYAMIQINEMVGYGNESPGDIGVKDYSNQEYSETRVPLLRTAYGNSTKANFIHHLMSPYRKRRHVGW